MTDRELLEMAASAANLPLADWHQGGENWLMLDHTAQWPQSKFHPLTNDGDALRLAAHLKIDIEWQSTNPFPEDAVEAYRKNPEGEFFCAMYPEKDYRRAIVRAAAEIGRGME